MKSFITRIIEPDRLDLIWKGSVEPFTNYRVGEVLKQSGAYVLRYLTGTSDFRLACEAGFNGYPGFKVSIPEHKENVLETLKKRVLPRSRDDYQDYLIAHGLSPELELSEFALLGYSGGKLPSDGFVFLHPFNNATGTFSFVTEASGYRYSRQADSSLRVGDKVELIEEPDNPYDPDAIKLCVQGQKIGYINRCQTSLFKKIISKKNEIIVYKLNGSESRPRLFLGVTVHED